ncbi:Signal transduction histidine-protein kinase BarA [Planctomycetes bacterium Pan216]|uniref:histidine kinase n=1 Tax=Kolteria novifilia TaxID=2527975 RepID=A0A518AXN7_9BACT|nr:Signal transduction histidine-protein kinase BarA [Planctomycetes bacterium Pan216]
MSYRTIKRLLGETSLERKCRLLLGGGILILILLSFFFYGYQTEKLVWDQTELSGEMLAYRVLLETHWPDSGEEPNGDDPVSERELAERELPDELAKEFPSKQQGEQKPPEWVNYTSRFLRSKSNDLRHIPQTEWERESMRLLERRDRTEVTHINREHDFFEYLRAITAQQSCLKCHPTALDRKLGYADLKEGDMMAAIAIKIPLSDTELAVNVNRAILLAFAIGTAILAMLFAYVTVRYVIVKPVAHLKEVSEEIASGNLDIRSNIETGDEFQELSHAFNRMLRRLVSMQDELRNVNASLDHKLDELARANMALFEMNRLKSDFLATISHELRTPLNSILGFSDLLAEVQGLEQKQQRWVGNIQSSGKMLLNMINDILDLAKLEAGKMQLHIEDFSLRDVVEGLIQMTLPLADKKNIALEAEIESSIPILHQDSGKLQQIISNLLSNAIKFTPEGGRIVVICNPEGNRVAISVADNGIGIAPEDQQLVFEKFRQSESGLTRMHGGTGLGLSIVRELTKLLGGDEVKLESEVGRGSTFLIRIPMHLESRDPMELSLGDDALEFSKARELEIRYYSSQDRAVNADSSG